MPLIFYLPLLLVVIIITYKAILFFSTRSRHKKLKYLFYYPESHITQTENLKRKESKQFQNILSMVALILLVLYFVLVILYLNPAEVEREVIEEQVITE
jgi:Na+/melibiose symporter-like transporter